MRVRVSGGLLIRSSLRFRILVRGLLCGSVRGLFRDPGLLLI